MERFKNFLLKHFETVVVVSIILSIVVAQFFIERKASFLSFYYLPVLFAGYFLGRRYAIATAVFSILAVSILALASPAAFGNGDGLLYVWLDLVSWAAFLFLTAAVVGLLFEAKQKQLEQLRAAYVGIVEILTKYLESTDRYTKGHSVRVSHLATDIAIAMELPRRDVDNIKTAALLHDIGKVEVSTDLIRKAAELTTDERDLMASHAEKGAELLQSVGSVLKEAVPLVLHHHQYYHNTESGLSLQGDGPPMGARIIAVADAYDAMVTDRPYRKGRLPMQAYQELRTCVPDQFDPRVVEALGLVMSSVGEERDVAG